MKKLKVTDVQGSEYTLPAADYRIEDGTLHLLAETPGAGSERKITASFAAWVSVYEIPETQEGDRS